MGGCTGYRRPRRIGDQYRWPQTPYAGVRHNLPLRTRRLGLEVYHYGLRNPQELAFDQFGNLFTGDNNSDGGDPARWVHAVEGGDSGWRIGWQFLNSAPWTTRRGPWLDEKCVFRTDARRIASRRSPTSATAHPASLTTQGTGFGDRYSDMFLMCDFKGTPSRSGIHAIRNAPFGAHFMVEKQEQVIWNVLLTDVEFGFDGNMYVSDWVNGWGMTGKGRLYRLASSEKDTAADGVKKLFRPRLRKTEGRPLSQAAEPRRHARTAGLPVRVGQAQKRQGTGESSGRFGKSARSSPRHLGRRANQPTRRLGQRAPLLPLLKDADAEVRAQTVKVLGDAGYNAAHATVVTLLRDKSARVRARAAIALSKLDQGAGDALIRLIAENNGNDPVVHHATILALTRHSSAGDLVKLNARKPAAIRTAAVVALREQRSDDVATFLNDGNALVQLEAARAIADEHIDSAMPQLARLAKRAPNWPSRSCAGHSMPTTAWATPGYSPPWPPTADRPSLLEPKR